MGQWYASPGSEAVEDEMSECTRLLLVRVRHVFAQVLRQPAGAHKLLPVEERHAQRGGDKAKHVHVVVEEPLGKGNLWNRVSQQRGIGRQELNGSKAPGEVTLVAS